MPPLVRVVEAEFIVGIDVRQAAGVRV